MTLQAELVEPEPTRTLTGRGLYGLGVDPSTLRLSSALVSADGREPVERYVHTTSFPREDGARRLALIYAKSVEHGVHCAQQAWPGLVWVEQPSGARPNPALSYATGAIQAGLYAGMWSIAGGRTMPIFEMVPSAQWKRLGVGKGWHKLDKGNGDIIRWARERCGYAGDLFDEADALGIAEALRRTVRLSP